MATDEYTTNPDPLGASVDRAIALILGVVPGRYEATVRALSIELGNIFTEVVSRAAVQSARAVVGFHEALKKDIVRLEGRLDVHAQRLNDLDLRVNHVDQTHIDEHAAFVADALPKDQRERYIGQLQDHEARLGALEQKQVGGDASNATG